MPRNYQDIKDLSEQTGLPVYKLLALAPKNDPFAADLPARRMWGEWFAALWDRFSFPLGYHLRRIHYRLVVDPSPPIMPVDKSKTSGRPFVNFEMCWQKLQLAGRDAR